MCRTQHSRSHKLALILILTQPAPDGPPTARPEGARLTWSYGGGVNRLPDYLLARHAPVRLERHQFDPALLTHRPCQRTPVAGEKVTEQN
jgi:hypothetical protein